MSVSIIGGVFLIIGAYLTSEGKIFHSILAYLFADMCWVYLSIKSDDFIGTTLIVIGTLLGLRAFYRMYSGEFLRSLRKF